LREQDSWFVGFQSCAVSCISSKAKNVPGCATAALMLQQIRAIPSKARNRPQVDKGETLIAAAA